MFSTLQSSRDETANLVWKRGVVKLGRHAVVTDEHKYMEGKIKDPCIDFEWWNFCLQSRTVKSLLQGNFFPKQINSPPKLCRAGSGTWRHVLGWSRVSNMELRGCGTPSLETIKLSPLYLCGCTTEGFPLPLHQHRWWDFRLPSHSAWN